MERERKEKKRSLGREAATLAVTVVALFAALLFALRSINGFAWFASSKEVNANGMSVSAGEETLFELAAITPEPTPTPSPGASAPAPTPTPEVFDFLEDQGYELVDVTSGEHKGLVVYLKNEVRNDDVEEGKDPYMLRPGSHGTIDFYVIPKQQTTGIKLSMNLRGVGIGANPDYPTAGSSEAEIIKGHILFFTDCEQQTQKYSGLITGGSTIPIDPSQSYVSEETFTLNGEQCTRYRVTIYWVWPRTLGSMVLPDGHASLYGSSLFAFSGSNVKDVTGTIFEEMRTFIANNSSFFCDPLDHEGDATPYATLAADVINNFAKLSDGYNNGDQRIGDTVDYLIVEFTAEAANGS